jgi:excisionase family DNA binding protein
MEKEFLTVPEVASRLGTTVTRTYQLVAKGRVPHVRRGRSVLVPRAALAQWLQEKTEEALRAVVGESSRRAGAPHSRVASAERDGAASNGNVAAALDSQSDDPTSSESSPAQRFGE